MRCVRSQNLQIKDPLTDSRAWGTTSRNAKARYSEQAATHVQVEHSSRLPDRVIAMLACKILAASQIILYPVEFTVKLRTENKDVTGIFDNFLRLRAGAFEISSSR